MEKFRYPGPSPFNQQEEKLFFGRDVEIDQLYTQVITNKIVVLSADSGSGKTSLVNAGLIKELRKNNPNYLSVIVCFESAKKNSEGKLTLPTSRDALIEQTINGIKTAIKEEQLAICYDIPYLLPKEDELWYWGKLLQKIDRTLILIFDQFENVEAYGRIQLDCFVKNLSTLVGNQMPDNFYQFMQSKSPWSGGENVNEIGELEREQYNQDTAFIRKPTECKALLIIQSDKYSVLNRVKKIFCNIFQATEELGLLDRSSALAAIVNPGQMEGEFSSPKIKFEGDADFLLAALVNKETGQTDPIELQIVCKYIETKVIDDLAKGIISKDEEGYITIKEGYLPKTEYIIDFFYEKCWEKARIAGMSDEAFEESKVKIIKELVTNSIRVPVLSASFTGKEDQVFINLIKTQLVKKLILNGNDYYQLCHNRLIVSAENDYANIEQRRVIRKNWEEKENDYKLRRKKKLQLITKISVISVAILVLSLLVIFYYRWVKKDAEKMVAAMTTAERMGNPTLSYIIGENWIERKRKSFLSFMNFDATQLVRDQLAHYDTTKDYIFLQDIYPFNKAIIYTTRQDGGNILFHCLDSTYSCNLNDKLVKVINRTGISGPLWKHIVLPNGYVNVTKQSRDNLLAFTDDSGHTFASIPAKNGLPADLSISPRKKYLYESKVLYEIKGSVLSAIWRNSPERKEVAVDSSVKDMPQTLPNNPVLVFIDDNNFVITKGNDSLSAYKITDAGVKFGRTFSAKVGIKVSPSLDGKENCQVKSMFIDCDGQYLFITYTSGDIAVHDTKKVVLGENALVAILKGHIGSITTISFSNDKHYMASAGQDGKVILWQISNMHQAASFNLPNNISAKYMYFGDAGKTIYTVNQDNWVVLWKWGKDKQKYNLDSLYHYADFNYRFLALLPREYRLEPTNAKIKAQYKLLLDDIACFPKTREFQDKEYIIILKSAYDSIEQKYKRINADSEYATLPVASRILIEDLYFDFLFRSLTILPTLEGISEIERNKKIAGYMKLFIKRALNNRNSMLPIENAMFEFRNTMRTYISDTAHYKDALNYLTFYTDSIVKPFEKQYHDFDTYKTLVLQLNKYWYRYYLVIGDTAKVEYYIEQMRHSSNLLRFDYRIYLALASLRFGNYDAAATLYEIISEEAKSAKFQNDANMLWLLREFENKVIDSNAVNKFISAFKLGTEE